MSSLKINRSFPKKNGKIETNGRFPIDSNLGGKGRTKPPKEEIYKQKIGDKSKGRILDLEKRLLA